MNLETISHYRILDKLGAGGMGEVYRARDTRLGHEVAIKVLPAEFAKDADRLRRFEQGGGVKVLREMSGSHKNVTNIRRQVGAARIPQDAMS